jgi:aminoglycoside 6'-N-acetyltransferase
MKDNAMITFEHLREEDLLLLCDWLNRPHMRDYYQKTPTSLAEVTEKFMPRIQGEYPTYDHIASYNGQPFGKIQCYKNVDHPEYAYEVDLQEGISVDLFIGEPALLGQGLGRRMLHEYVTTVAFGLYPDERDCFICHELTNLPARACSRAAGFEVLREVTEEGIASELLVFHKQIK